MGLSGVLALSVVILVVCLPNDETSQQVLLAEALPHARRGQVFIDTSTVEQATSIRCAKACSEKGVEFLDTPISGGPTKAKDGTLTIMCGGPEQVFKRALPVLQCMGSHVRLMGPHGAGTATKLVNQLLVGVHSVAACEAMLLADKLGIRDQQALREVLQTSFGCSEVLKRHMPVIAAGDFKTSGMPLRNMVKDLKIVHTSAREAGLSLPITAATEKVHTDTAREEYGDWDMAVPYVVLGRSEKDMCGPRLGISDEQWGF